MTGEGLGSWGATLGRVLEGAAEAWPVLCVVGQKTGNADQSFYRQSRQPEERVCSLCMSVGRNNQNTTFPQRADACQNQTANQRAHLSIVTLGTSTVSETRQRMPSNPYI